ncbi:MAG: hypothetical protein LC725_08750 [Lentisphaerae bacterium]|nr:hypothetical protein [Lentisphaerota bacterium]
MRRSGRPAVFLVLGRQLVAAERIEVLGLACTAELSDGLPARDLLHGVRQAGGVPVLPWAPGKWLGARGRLVAELVAAGQPGPLLVGDTTLRPAGWPSPGLARACLPCVPGSDPLPLPGEERWLGAYGFCYRAEFDAGCPVTELRRILSQPSPLLEPVGRRGSLAVTIQRLARLKLRKPDA